MPLYESETNRPPDRALGGASTPPEIHRRLIGAAFPSLLAFLDLRRTRPEPRRVTRRGLALARLMAVFGLCILAAGRAQGEPKEGDVRLVGGDGPHHGRVEIFATPAGEDEARWGIVCDDSWDRKNGEVVCRQLGIPIVEEIRTWFFLPRGSGTFIQTFLLDDVNCDGTESRLLDCPRYYGRAVGEHDCRRGENAGVRCLIITDTPTMNLHPESVRVFEGGDVSYRMYLGKEPSDDVTVTVEGTAGTDLTVSPPSFTFTTSTWDTPKYFVMTAGHDSDKVDDTVTLTHTATGANYESAAEVNLGVTIVDDDMPDVILSRTDVKVWEQSRYRSGYIVTLGGAPGSTMTISVGGATGTDLTVIPESFTFTTSSWWREQIVELWARGDPDVFDDSATLTHVVTGGGVYDGWEVPDVQVTVVDNDDPGGTVWPQTLATREGDATGTSFKLKLNAAPVGATTVSISQRGPDYAELSLSPPSLTFTAETWKVTQTVTVVAVDDPDRSSGRAYLNLFAHGGGPYDGLRLGRLTVNVDDDDVHVRATPTALEIDEDDSATYELRIDGNPRDSLTVSVRAPPGSGLVASPASVVFTRANWNSRKTVQLVANQDDDWSDQTWMVTHVVEDGENDLADDLEVQVHDLGAPGLWIDGGTLGLTEGQSRRVFVLLRREPNVATTVTLSVPQKLDVSPSSLTFNSSNYREGQSVTLEALHDDDTSNERFSLTATVMQGSLSKAVSTKLVVVTDDDDGESLLGPGPAGSLWWAALTARRAQGTGYRYYSEFEELGKLSRTSFSYRGITYTVRDFYADHLGGLLVSLGSASGSQLPNNLVLHVGNESLALGTATRQSFHAGRTPDSWKHDYWWLSGDHAVSLSDREVVLVWLEEPAGESGLPGVPSGLEALALDRAADLRWVAPPESEKPIQYYEYQKSGDYDWFRTDGPETHEKVSNLENGEDYRFRLRGVNESGKGTATAPSTPVTPTAGGLVAKFVSAPSMHDGTTAFSLRVEFSESVATGSAAMRDHVFEVIGGAVTRAQRVQGRSDLWELTVAPSTNGAVTVTLESGRACDVAGAVCTASGDRLERGAEATVAGPLPEVSVAAGTSPVTEGAAAAYTLSRTGATASSLTVSVSVTEDGAVLSGTSPAEAVFPADSGTSTLSVSTEDDEVAGDGGVVTVMVVTGTGYTVDGSGSSASVTVEDDDAAPVITSVGPFTVDEGVTAVVSLTATDEDTEVADLVWSVAGGTDGSAFELSAGGVLSFASAKDFEAPDDADADGAYEVTARVSDGANETRAELTVNLASPVGNAAPTGVPTITGRARVGETLTASATGVSDADGLVNATFSWQWVANDGTDDADISGATSASYALTSSEAGKTVKVRLTFTDDGGTRETLSSAATSAVEVPFSARLAEVAERHDGTSEFTLELHFSEEPVLSYVTVRDRAMEVGGGTVRRARRLERGSNLGWQITIAPSGDGDVTAGLPARTCGVSGAVCMPDGRALVEGISVVVPGPLPAALPEVSVAAGTSPVTEGAAAAYTLSRTGATASSLTVSVSVTEDGAVLSGTSPAEAVFPADSGTSTLSVSTEDDEVAGDGGVVTVMVVTGTGYTVDGSGSSASVTVEDDDAAPVITSVGPFPVDEGTTAVVSLTATDEDTEVADLVWSVAGGTDGSAFELSAGGVLSFASAKDFEAPDDADADGAYEVTVRVSDGANETRAELTVRISDVEEVAALPEVSVAAGTSPVTEGEAAAYTLSRTGATASSLTVSVSVTEDGAVLSGTSPAEAVFPADSGTSTLSVSTEDDEVAGDGGVVTVMVVTGTGYTVDGSGSSASVTVEDDDAAPVITFVGPFPVDEGTTAVVSLTATDEDTEVADLVWSVAGGADGSAFELSAGGVLSFASAKDFEAPDDADADGAYEVTVRVSDGANETRAELTVRISDVEEVVALPVVSIAAGTSPVTEGIAATFTLERTGDTASVLTVSVSVRESGSVIAGTPAAQVAFASGSDTSSLTVSTDDDAAAEADGRVGASVMAGSGYRVSADAGSAEVQVHDDDEVSTPAATYTTLWSSTLTWTDLGSDWLIANSADFSSPSWTEDGYSYQVWYFAYEHDTGDLWLRLKSDLRAGGIPGPGKLRLQVGAATLEPGDVVSAFAASRLAIARNVDQSWEVGDRVTVRLVRSESGGSQPGISVADARVDEDEGAELSFRVTLEAAQSTPVSVRYATSDGTAQAGLDYEAVSGSLRFEAGETQKTVSVPIHDDADDEGSETLSLSNAFGATLSDGEAVGTIVNSDAMPQAWIGRFGRTVGVQAMEAIGKRLLGGATRSGAPQVAVGGMNVVRAGGLALDERGWKEGTATGTSGGGQQMSERQLVLGSSFRIGAGGAGGSSAWTGWGRFATGGFDGRADGVPLSGEVTSGFLGADVSSEDWLLGLAVGVSEGEGTYDDGGTVTSTLTSLFPYLRLGVGEGMEAWGIVGFGNGDLTLANAGEVTRTGLSMRMGALGVRGELVGSEAKGNGLAIESDAFWVQSESDAASTSAGGNLEAASADVSRVRLALEGSRTYATVSGGTLTPSAVLGVRHDGGDAENGAGLEAGLGLVYKDPALGLTVTGGVRGLLAHADEGYREWGASGSLGFQPHASGRGVSFVVLPEWGSVSKGATDLWSAGPGAGLDALDRFEPESRLRAELGYGVRPPGGRGMLTPFAGLAVTGRDDARSYRLGARWRTPAALELVLEASHGVSGGDAEPINAATLRAGLRW